MRFNNLAALLAISQTAVGQTAIASTSEDIPTPIATPIDSIQIIEQASTEAPIHSTVTDDDFCSTDLPESEPTHSATHSTSDTLSTSTSAHTSVGRETVSILNVVTVENARKRAPTVVTEAATVAVCPIYANQVPDVPCYPCAVGEPTGQQFLGVQTVSLL